VQSTVTGADLFSLGFAVVHSENRLDLQQGAKVCQEAVHAAAAAEEFQRVEGSKDVGALDLFVKRRYNLLQRVSGLCQARSQFHHEAGAQAELAGVHHGDPG